ncbi:MAG TPA: CopG family transcriptional regulator [Jiangellaceae bacterium]|nr:CopG family transcriptional regulator [Jiangellaceae bacterium]
MSRTQTMVQLTEHLIELLDNRAARIGVSRSHVIREALEAFLASDREAVIDRQIVEGYERVPQGGEYDTDEWGDAGNLMTALTAQQLRALNEEEREAGFEPW